ncbi:MAG: SMC-Scp complex subunit ScpB [Candidatus Omnitrophica bacterium]|nr:SMC-Scp complex subunit ScpB [Candidatus Omnitrophota bacterium]
MQDNRKSAIEALLFASEKPLALEQIKLVLDNPDTNEVRQLLEEMKSEYEQSGRGVRIAEIAGGFQMISASEFAPFLRKLFKGRRIERLSKPALETLAIIAYKQPLTRSEVELLRNVNVDGVMKSLLEKNLIRISGRKKAPGRPCVYGTTRQFMEYFGLRSLADLPRIEEFSSLAQKQDLVDIEPEEKKNAEELNESQKTAQ